MQNLQEPFINIVIWIVALAFFAGIATTAFIGFIAYMIAR